MNTQSTQSLRRVVLWNVEQPGDPYDIRKSMIAKLPEHSPRFMGDNLELVCLFQAAEIERLAQFLDQMTTEMRTIERDKLDKHLYEVQIKELAEKLQLANDLKNQNSKLRQFIRGMQQQNQNLQRFKSTEKNYSELQTRYESALNQLKICREKYEAERKIKTELLNQISELKQNYQKMDQKLSQARSAKERQIRFAVQKASSESRHLYESRQYQLKGEISVLKQNLMLKNQQINLEKQKNEQTLRKLAEKEQLISKYMRGQIEIHSSKTQQLLRISNKLDELTYTLEQKQKSIVSYKDQNNYLNKQIKQLQEELIKKERELKAKQSEFNNNPELIQKFVEMQRKLNFYASEAEKFKQISFSRQRQLNQREKQIIFYKDKSFAYEKSIESLQRQIRDRESTIKKLEHEINSFGGKQSKIQTLGMEVIKLNRNLEEKIEEISRLSYRIREYSQTESHHLALIKTKDQAIKVLQSRCKDYQIKLGPLQEFNKLNFDQINRLNIKITSLQNTNIQLRRQVDSKQFVSTELNQLKNLINSLNQEINYKSDENKKLREDNQNMFLEIRSFEQKNLAYQTQLKELKMSSNQRIIQKDTRIQQTQYNFSIKEKSYLEKIKMLESSLPKMQTEIERLHQFLQKKQAQIKRLQENLEIEREKNRIAERRNSTQLEARILDYERSIKFYESKCKNYEKINTQLIQQKTKIAEKILQLQENLKEKYFELNKIISTVQVKQANSEEYEKLIGNLNRTIHQLRQQNLVNQSELLTKRQQLELNFEMMKKLQYELDLSKKDLNKSKNDYSNLMNEFHRLKIVYDQKQKVNPAQMQIVDDLKHKLLKFQNQSQYLIADLNERKRRAELIQEETRNLKSKLSELQGSIDNNERVHQIKMEDLRQRLIQEFDGHLKKQIDRYNQLQETYNQLELNYQQNHRYYEDQGDKFQKIYSQNTELRKNLEEYQQKIFSYEERIALISQQIQRLSIENESLKQKIQQMPKNQVSNRDFQFIKEELDRKQLETGNLKQILSEYESMNSHAIFERDELFRITHEQQQYVKQYQSTIQRLSAQLQSLRVNQSNLAQIQQLKQQNSIMMNQYSTLKMQYSDLSSQFQMTNRRISQLSAQSIRQKDFQIKQLEIKIHNITNHYETALKLQRQQNAESNENVNKLSRALDLLENETNALREKLSSFENNIIYMQQKQTQMQQLKTAYINIKIENQELNRMLQQMQDQLFEANEKNQEINLELQSELAKQNSELKITLNQERRILQNLRNQFSILSAEMGHIKKQTESKIQSLSASCMNLQDQNTFLKQQAQSLQLQISSLSVYQQISSDLEVKFNNLFQAYKQTYENFNQMKNQSENLKNTEQKFNLLSEQFDKLNDIVIQMKHQINTLRTENQGFHEKWQLRQKQVISIVQMNQNLQNELKRMYERNKDLTEQVNQLRLRLTDEHSLQQKIKQHLVLFVMLCTQIDSLRKRVQQTEKQCEEVRRSSIGSLKSKK